MVALFRGTDNSPKELFVYHTAGYDGYGGSSYIDTVICRDRDSNSGWANAGDGTLERRDYYCHNWRGDVVCLITSTGGMVEWIRYSAYGEPCLIINGDTNGDFAVNSSDLSNINNNWGSSNYPTGDFNLNGTIDVDDMLNVTNTQWNKNGGWGLLTYGGISGTIANRKGYVGYEHLAALTRTKWDVRFRVLESGIGRWSIRDPLGIADGISLYAFVANGPLQHADPSGLVQIKIGMCSSTLPDLCGNCGNYDCARRFFLVGQDPCTPGNGVWIQEVTIKASCAACGTALISPPNTFTYYEQIPTLAGTGNRATQCDTFAFSGCPQTHGNLTQTGTIKYFCLGDFGAAGNPFVGVGGAPMPVTLASCPCFTSASSGGWPAMPAATPPGWWSGSGGRARNFRSSSVSWDCCCTPAVANCTCIP